MNAKKILAAALVAIVALPAFVAAEQFEVGPKNEQVVEGHTVFALLENVRQGTAVAVLVRENQPKVLWFNDQYLVGEEPRYPCGGFVMAVNEGGPDPRSWTGNTYPQTQGLLNVIENVEYIESYRITDPNDFEWTIDKYELSYIVQFDPTTFATSGGTDGLILGQDRYPIWVGSILNSDLTDDGTSSCDPIVDAPTGPTAGPPGSGDGYLDPGLNAHCYSGGQYYDDGAERCGPVTASCPGIANPYPGSGPANGLTPVCDWPRLYNGLLFMLWEDLTVLDGSKQYGCADTAGDGSTCVEGNPDFGVNNAEKNGCEEGPTDAHEIQYDCVEEGAPDANEDDNEGNSHAYNPTLCDTDGDGVLGSAGDTPCWGELHTHETKRIDIYFDSTKRPPQPPVRTYVIDDTVGSEAPFHGHTASCGTPAGPPGWISPGGVAPAPC